MGSRFARSLQRGAARDLGLLMSRGRQIRTATKARRMWCPKCERVCDSWSELSWSKPNAKNVKTLLCARCGAPVEAKTLFELPPNTSERGLWLKPGPGGWMDHERREKDAENGNGDVG